ncbi:zinc ABC transporter permease [Vibrio xuii]|nr:zinc ABC transporter permease [Vibrio xuii]
MKRLILLSTWFQLLWFLAVLGREQWQYLTLALVVTTLLFSVMNKSIEWKKLSAIVVFGILLDYFNIGIGWFVFEQAGIPFWLIALWGIFAWYAYFLYPILNQYPTPIVLTIGGIAGFLSYFAGSKLGAVSFGLSLSATGLILVFEWVIVMAVILKVYGYESNTNDGLFDTSK